MRRFYLLYNLFLFYTFLFSSMPEAGSYMRRIVSNHNILSIQAIFLCSLETLLPLIPSSKHDPKKISSTINPNSIAGLCQCKLTRINTQLKFSLQKSGLFSMSADHRQLLSPFIKSLESQNYYISFGSTQD